ncbi:pyridoxal-phosphate dependent enzyme [bacterium]|nr:pyridoxal-phosphate dependent enzyme [candidate division CSSED10-310 bacterium]
MDTPFVLLCSRCGHIESVDVPFWCCPICRAHWELRSDHYAQGLPVEEDKFGVWRYRQTIPVPGSAGIVSLGEPSTALTAESVANRPVWFKHEYQQPSGSFKDRGATVLITMARHLGVDRIVADSSGNAGAAVAAYSARAGIACRIFVPASTSEGKLRQIMAYGADLERVPGTREETAAAAVKEAETAFYASHYRHPLLLHGVKTMAFELWEQMGHTVPGTVVVPVGNGSLILGLYTGFKELIARGIMDVLPRLIGVQSRNCSPVVDLFHHQPVKDACKPTLAEGIAVTRPFLGEMIVAAVRETGGGMITVTEELMEEAFRQAWHSGLCIEKTAAVGPAGVRAVIESRVDVPDPILTVLTGHGLK